MGEGSTAVSGLAHQRGAEYSIIPFAEEHSAMSAARFSALPSN